MSTLEELKAGVSRETFERLEAYAQLIQRWTPKINLVSKSQLSDLWDRHIWDSAQLFDHLPAATHVVDIGSGGGLPAIVLACMDTSSDAHDFTLIESDTRKSVFLRTAARELDLRVTVLTNRWDVVDAQASGAMTARALSPLTDLLGAADRHLARGGIALFPKGATWQQEIDVARKKWAFRVEAIPSITNPSAAVLRIEEIERV